MVDAEAIEFLERMKRKVERAQEEVSNLKRAANTIARVEQLPLPYPDVDAEHMKAANTRVRADQFTNYTAPSTAARAFLESRGQSVGAASLEEVLEALKRGGYIFEHRDENSAKNALRIALGKDGQIIKLPNGTYGLISWYDKIQRERGSDTSVDAAAEQSLEPKRGRGRPPKVLSVTRTEPSKPPEQQGPEQQGSEGANPDDDDVPPF